MVSAGESDSDEHDGAEEEGDKIHGVVEDG
jgi:hypothetical protein